MEGKCDLIDEITCLEWLKHDLWTVSEAVKLLMGYDPDYQLNGFHHEFEDMHMSEAYDTEGKWYEEDVRMRSEDYYKIENLMRLSLLTGALKNHAEGDMKAALSSAVQKRDDDLIVIESEWAHHAYVKPQDVITWAKDKQINLSPELSGDTTIKEANEYVSPFIQFMLKATKELGITAADQPRHADLKEWLSRNWAENLPSMTDNLLKNMATLIRSPEAAKGGNKKRN